MTEEKALWEAEFNPGIRQYWLLTGAWILAITVVGIPLLLFWFPFGLYITQRYLERMRCTLTTRSLKVEKGILIRQEKSIPLDKITDVGLVQGPIMRMLELESIAVETAGQNIQGRPNLRLDGIIDGRKFRDAVLRQRDKVMDLDTRRETAEPPPAAAASEDTVLLREIRDILKRMDERVRKPD